MQWFRWYHGTASDPKFGGIARRSRQTRERVLFVWAMLLESASEGEPRGAYSVTADDIADVLHCETSDIDAVLACMQDAGMIAGSSIQAWEKRQAARDDSAARQRKKRERDADVTRTARDSDADVTPLEVEIEKDTDTSSLRSDDGFPPSQGEGVVDQIWGPGLNWLAKHSDRDRDKIRSFLGRAIKEGGEETVRDVLEVAMAQPPPADPISWVRAAVRARKSDGRQTDETEAQRSAERVALVVARRRSESGLDGGARADAGPVLSAISGGR